MAVALSEIIKKLSPNRQRKIKERSKQLIEEEMQKQKYTEETLNEDTYLVPRKGGKFQIVYFGKLLDEEHDDKIKALEKLNKLMLLKE